MPAKGVQTSGLTLPTRQEKQLAAWQAWVALSLGLGATKLDKAKGQLAQPAAKPPLGHNAPLYVCFVQHHEALTSDS